MTDTRQSIVDCIRSEPGIHFNALVRRLDLAPGQVQYHLRIILNDDDLLREHLYGKTHYYPSSVAAWERRALALLRRETAAEIVSYLLEYGRTDPATVADELDIARSTLEWHLSRLTEQELVTKEWDGQHRVTLTVERPTELVRLLREVDPTLFERMVDRFTRLVDDLLEE
ncbi:winged helix-turn-helix transcriptional regulator [Halocatena salina]|uniref:Winged helix-turn-helix transcriptional regulator n=1 Tax=Halocatena salina TaxID=2934340 RepID=A0A8U0A8D4_9EURY|nr:winged helix-turn-helix transcriptional regulator [Halocatena salina]UPM44187.1 winged helix-turn-helix transcriptional regulator [Halocatena salina]